MMNQEVQSAEVMTIALLVSVALSALSYLLRPKPKNDLKIDSTQTTLTTRGSYAPLIIGMRPVAPVVAWAGDRETVERSAGGAKGVGGAGGGITEYVESSVHILAGGLTDKLHSIKDGGKVIWEGPIDRTNTPSGTTVTTENGSFMIWWGEDDQPVCEYLADETRLGIASSWAPFCYLIWIRRNLGSSPRWGQLTYLISANAVGSTLSESVAVMSATDAEADDSGVNAAHAIYQIATGLAPYGSRVPVTALDFGTLEALGALFDEEHLPVSLEIKDGATAADVLADLMSELGFLMPQVGDKLVFIPVRREDSPPEFTLDQLSGPRVEEDSDQGDIGGDRTVFLYLDRTKNFRPSDPQVDNDAEARMTGTQKTKDVTLVTVTDRITANKLAARRGLEDYTTDSRLRIYMGFTARQLYPGASFILENYGRYRVASIAVSTDKGFATINVSTDLYGDELRDWAPENYTINGSVYTPEPDDPWAVFEVPYAEVGDSIEIAAMRIRANPGVGNAAILVSSDDESYNKIGDQPTWARGGTLMNPLRADGPVIDVDGPLVVPFNNDIRSTLDLSGNYDGWMSGMQVALIGDEICYVQRANPVSGTSNYRAAGLVRGRAGTMQKSHPAGTPIFIASRSAIRTHVHPTLVANELRYFKSQPDRLPAEDASRITYTVRGVAKSPMPVDNLCMMRGYELIGEAVLSRDLSGRWVTVAGAVASRFPRGRRVWWTDRVLSVYRAVHEGATTKIYFYESISPLTATGSIYPINYSKSTYETGAAEFRFFWTYRVRDGNGLAAGEQSAGSAITLDSNGIPSTVTHEGEFEVKISDPVSGEVKRTFVLSSPTLIYNSALRIVDFGTSDPLAVKISVTNRRGGLRAWTRSQVFQLEA